MTITPDDLPGAGPQQVLCSCMSELFRVILNGGEIVAECSSCGSTAQRWPAVTGMGPALGETAVGAGRDTLHGNTGGGSPHAVHASWGPEPPSGEEALIAGAMGKPPALPDYSDEMRNASLDGGPYDGQETWIMDAMNGGRDFHIAGVASYRYSGRMRDNGGKLLAVYEYVPPPQV